MPGAPSGPLTCDVRVVPVSAPAFEDLPAGPGFKLRVRAEVRNIPATAKAKVTWRVAREGAGMQVPTTALDADGLLIELPLELPGRYQIDATAVSGELKCVATAIAYARQAGTKFGHFRVRATPPPSLGLPVQEVPLQLRTGVPLVQPLVLQRGVTVDVRPQDEVGQRDVYAYVRISQPGSRLLIEGHTRPGPVMALLLSPLTYDVLIVPDDTFAPLLVTGRTPAALNVLSQKLTRGNEVRGTVIDGAGAPVRDARVILRAGALTSTVGVSDASGAFDLRVREGTFGLVVSPAPGSGLPEAHVVGPLQAAPGAVSAPSPPIAGAGLAFPGVAGRARLTVQWKALPKVRLSLQVRSVGGTAEDARVRVELDPPLLQVASVRFTATDGSVATLSAQGQLRATVTADGAGRVELPGLPAGRYRVTAAPGEGLGGAATTAWVDATRDADAQLVLAERVRVPGQLLPAGDTAGVRVVAIDTGADLARPLSTATVGVDGTYTIELEPRRGYLFMAEPPTASRFARHAFHRIDAVDLTTTAPERTLPRGLAWSGSVQADGRPRVPGVGLQLFCDPTMPECFDSTRPVAEGTSDAEGSFRLVLPDPGP
jgi:hypothetical protein